MRPVAPAALLLLALVAGLGTGCPNPGSPPPSQAEEPEGFVTVGRDRVEVELAITPQEQRLGLGERDALDWGHGMLFLYDRAAFHRFWMKGMRFDIDIVWIRGDRIVDISHGVKHVPGGTGDLVAPKQLADTVLEVPAGYASSRRWQPGQRVEIELIRAWPDAPARAR